MFEQTVRVLSFVKTYGYSVLTGKPSRCTYEITRRCNLYCPDCYVYNFNPSCKNLSRQKIFETDKQNELTFDEYENIFKKEILCGCKSIFLIGGEPTLRMNIIKLAYDFFGRNLSLITNGIIKIPINLKFPFAVSIDGGELVHDKIRGKDSWKRIFNNYKEDHRVILSCCLRKGTVDQIQQIIDDWVDTDVFGASFFFLTPPKGNSSVTVLGDERKYVKNELHRVIDEYPNFVRMTHSLVDLLYEINEDECPVFRYSKWYDYKGNLKRHCLLGEEADCKLCGCISPLYMKMASKWWRHIDKRILDIMTLPRDIKQCRQKGEK
jgi:MoaA/NifB/PqqE/SkfB family radical SAM enzyme